MVYDEDTQWMELALQEGARGLGRTRPNPPVGAVLVRRGRFVGKGFHAAAGGPHAEIVAMQSVKLPEDLRGATLYVTLEPCSTEGRTPPCVEALVDAGIGRVVIGTLDPNPRHAGRGVELLQARGVGVTTGILEARCAHLVRFFARHITKGRPYVVAKTGMTLDGRITPPEGGARWITSEAARADVQRLRAGMDAIVIGGETLRRDNPRLTLRGEWAREGELEPLRVVVTRSGDIPKDAQLFMDEKKGLTRLFHVEHLDTALEALGAEGVTGVLLECGGNLMAHAFERRLVDEVTFYVAPRIGGGARRAVEGSGFAWDLDGLEVDRVGPDLRISARVNYGSGVA